MNVTILAGRVDRGAGSHVYHQELTCRLAARGHRVTLVCFEAVPEVLGRCEVFELPPVRFDQRPIVWRLTSWLQYRHCTRGLLASKVPAAEVAIGGEHLFLKGYRRKFPRTPLIYLPHSLVVSQEIESYGLPPAMRWTTLRMYGHLQRWALNHAERTLRFTKQGCEALTTHYGGSVRPRFVVNAVGIDLPARPRSEVASDEVRLLVMGQLIPRKRIDTALSALSGLRHYRWRLDVVGDGPLRKALERQAEESELSDRVHFRGFHPDPTEWYDRADLLLFPSKSESLGLVVLEAMSHGVPCLAMRADGVHYWNVNAEIIDPGRTGLLADGEADFGPRLESVLKRPEQLCAMGREARRYVAEHHTWDGHLDRYETLFAELSAESRRGGSN